MLAATNLQSVPNNFAKNSAKFCANEYDSTNTRFATRFLSRRWALSQDLRRHFPAKFRRALSLDDIKPENTHHGPFSALLTRFGLNAPSPPSPRHQPTFTSPRRGHRVSTTRDSSRGDTSFETERSSRSDSVVVDEVQGGQWSSGGNRRALSIPTPRRPRRNDRPATSGDRGRLRLTAPACKKELGR